MKRNVLTQYLIITASCALYAVGFNWMFDPNHISVGGFTGVAQIINHFLPMLPVGTIALVLNIPLFILGWQKIGRDLLISSLYATAVSSLMIDGLAAVHTFKPMEPILGCIFGGVIMGGSLGVVFLQGATTGGTDLMARLLKLKMAWLPMGKLLMAIDLVVIVAGYTDLMEKFIHSNPGLESRFNRFLLFPDYTTDEMMAIFKMRCGKGYVLTAEAEPLVRDYIAEESAAGDSFGNARGVRNIFEHILVAQNNRLAKMENVTRDDLMALTADDVLHARGKLDEA
mgnify:CR=1 FL=1